MSHQLLDFQLNSSEMWQNFASSKLQTGRNLKTFSSQHLHNTDEKAEQLPFLVFSSGVREVVLPAVVMLPLPLELEFMFEPFSAGGTGLVRFVLEVPWSIVEADALVVEVVWLLSEEERTRLVTFDYWALQLPTTCYLNKRESDSVQS